jgi:hypothetical protein
MSDYINTVVENLTCVSFPRYIGEYGWKKTPYGFFVKFQEDDLYSVRTLTICPFDATHHRFLVGGEEDVSWGSKREAIEAEEEFAAARAYRIYLTKTYSGVLMERKVTDGFEDMISQLASMVEKLEKDDYYYIPRTSPEPEELDARMSIEAKDEEIAFIRSRQVYHANNVDIPDPPESIVPVTYKMVHSSNAKRIQPKENELVVSEDAERVQQVFHSNLEAAFIYLGEKHEIDSVIYLRSVRNTIQADVPDGFTNVTKRLADVITNTSMEVSDDTEESMEGTCIRVLFQAGFVFMYHTDDYGTKQLAKARTLAEQARSVELLYD